MKDESEASQHSHPEGLVSDASQPFKEKEIIKLRCDTCGKCHITAPLSEQHDLSTSRSLGVEEHDCKENDQHSHKAEPYDDMPSNSEHVDILLNSQPPEVMMSLNSQQQTSSNAAFDKSLRDHTNQSITDYMKQQLRDELSTLPLLTNGKESLTPLSQAVLKLQNHRGSFVPFNLASLKGATKRQRLHLEVCDLYDYRKYGSSNDVLPISDDVFSSNKSLLNNVCEELGNRLTTIEKGLSSLQSDREPHLEVSIHRQACWCFVYGSVQI